MRTTITYLVLGPVEELWWLCFYCRYPYEDHQGPKKETA